jgi:hypothetical protein
MVDLATVVYLAAFDGHKEIFMLGYTDETLAGHNEWMNQIAGIFRAYTGTKFYLVGEPTRMPDVWVSCPNTQVMPYSDFIGYCDV